MTTPLETIAAGGKAALARALARIEAAPEAEATQALLDEAWTSPRGQALGLTGPPGVGKSTLLDAMIRRLRAAGQRVGVIAVDPSSRASRGALLGDRTRLSIDPDDDSVFVRSMAARDRLGGLAEITFPALVLLRALYDVVIVETVGIGQSETDIAEVADTVLFCAQPGSGDALQFMKAGVMEIPDIVVVTKADMGAVAERTAADLKGALSLTTPLDVAVPVLQCSATTGEGIDALLQACETRRTALDREGALDRRRSEQFLSHARQSVITLYGVRGLALVTDSFQNQIKSGDICIPQPFTAALAARRRLERALIVGFRQQARPASD